MFFLCYNYANWKQLKTNKWSNFWTLNTEDAVSVTHFSYYVSNGIQLHSCGVDNYEYKKNCFFEKKVRQKNERTSVALTLFSVEKR